MSKPDKPDILDLNTLDPKCPVHDLRPEIQRVLENSPQQSLDVSTELRAIVAILLPDLFERWQRRLKPAKRAKPVTEKASYSLERCMAYAKVNCPHLDTKLAGLAGHIKGIVFHDLIDWEEGQRRVIAEGIGDEGGLFARAFLMAEMWQCYSSSPPPGIPQESGITEFIVRGLSSGIGFMMGLTSVIPAVYEREYGEKIDQATFEAILERPHFKKLLLQLANIHLARLIQFMETLSKDFHGGSYFPFDSKYFTLKGAENDVQVLNFRNNVSMPELDELVELERFPKTRCPALYAQVILPLWEEVRRLLKEHYLPEFPILLSE